MTIRSRTARYGSQHANQFHKAVREGDLSTVVVLLIRNPDLVFTTDQRGNSPLHVASRNGHTAVAELLLANKADVNAMDRDGFTPLHFAEILGHLDLAELLRRHGGKREDDRDNRISRFFDPVLK
jgi:ankyrin repeat protein